MKRAVFGLARRFVWNSSTGPICYLSQLARIHSPEKVDCPQARIGVCNAGNQPGNITFYKCRLV